MTYAVFWTFGIFGWWLPDGSYVQPPHRDDYRRAGLASAADCDRYRAQFTVEISRKVGQRVHLETLCSAEWEVGR